MQNQPSIDKEIDVLIALYNSQVQEVIAVGSTASTSIMIFLAGAILSAAAFYVQNDDKRQKIHKTLRQLGGQAFTVGALSISGAFIASFQRQTLIIASRIHALEERLISLTQHTDALVSPEHLQFSAWYAANIWHKFPMSIFITDLADLGMVHRDGHIITGIVLLFAGLSAALGSYFRFVDEYKTTNWLFCAIWFTSVFALSFASQAVFLWLQ